MLIYALSDAKVVIYLFEIFIGFYLYLNTFNLKYLFADDNNNDKEGKLNIDLNLKEYALYFETIIQKMKSNKLDDKSENLNSLTKFKTNKEKEKDKFKDKYKDTYKSKLVKAFEFLKPFNILMESELYSLEIIKLKIINDYKKLNITFKE